MPKKRPVFLFAFANDDHGSLRLTEEERMIRELLIALDRVGDINYKSIGQTTLPDIYNTFNAYHDQIWIFHYGGHSDSQLLHLHDQPARSDQLAVLMGQQKNLKLVFLNGCANHAQLTALLDNGVPAVIATQVEVSDELSIQLAGQFYRALVGGKTLLQAFNTAASYIRQLNSDLSIDYRGQKLEGEEEDAFPWGLYARDRSVLDWHLGSSSRRISANEYYHTISMPNIQAQDFLGTRAKPDQGFRPQYVQRPYLDDRLQQNFEKRKATIITGKPLAGKSRAIFECCNRLRDDQDAQLLLFNRQHIEIANFAWPDTRSPMVLFIDDFEQFLAIEHLVGALEQALLHPAIWVVATCRKESMPLVEGRLVHLYHNFEVCEITAISAAEQQAFETQIPDKLNHHSDKTFGSYLLPIHEMRRRFDQLPPNSLEREIFHACKALRLLNNVNYLGRYTLSRVQQYCSKRRLYYYQNETQIAPYEWDQALERLHQLGLIGIVEEGTIGVEELYLERFLRITDHKLQKEILQYYPTVINYSIFLHKAANWSQAQGVLDQMRGAGILPNEFTYNSLLNKAVDWLQAQGVLDQMQEAGVQSDEVTYSTLMNKASDWSQAQGVLDQMREAGVQPDGVTYNSLMNKASDWSQAQGVLDQMQEAGVQPDEFTYSTLMNKASDWSQAQGVLDQMRGAGVQPDEFTYSTLMNKASDWSQAQGVLDQMREAGVQPNEFTYSTLLNKASDWLQAQGVLDQMREAGVPPDGVTYNSLLNKASDWSQAQGVLDQMRGAGVQPDGVTYNSLLNKAVDWSQAQGVLDQMREAGVQPDEFTYNSLMNKAVDWSQAQGVLDQMREAGVQPNEFTYNSLMSKASDWSQAQGVLDQMREAGVPPNEFTYNSLLNKASDWLQAQGVLDQMREAGVQPDGVTYNSLLNKAANWSQAQGVLDQMREAGVPPNEFTYNSLLNKASDWLQAQGVLDQMREAGVQPDGVTYNSLLNKAANWSQAQGVLDQMREAGVQPDEFTYNSLLNKAANWSQAQGVLDQMREADVPPNEFTYNSLLNKAADWLQAQKILDQFPAITATSNLALSSTLLKIANQDRDATYQILTAIPAHQLLEKAALHLVFRDALLPQMGARAFFAKYFDSIIQQSDRVIRFFVEGDLVPFPWKLQLLENLRQKNWQYYKLKADALLETDWESSLALLEEALKTIPKSYIAQVHAIWAKVVVFNDVENLFADAAEHLLAALSVQSQNHGLTYTGKLLLWLQLRQATDTGDFLQQLSQIISDHGFSKRLVARFLVEEIWKDFPGALIEKHQVVIRKYIDPNAKEKDYFSGQDKTD